MYLPYDAELGIHPQDEAFLERERWDFDHTPPDKYPLLLHYHPLVIYRHQVLKQADVVLAMALRADQFPLDQKRRNFDYYDPITTGDSSLSACVQALAAAQIGYEELAVEYFREALFVDLADLHGNTSDGVHIASAGGVWGTIVFGFAGLHDTGVSLTFAPRLPSVWKRISFRVQRHGHRLRVDLDAEGCTVTVLDGLSVPIGNGEGRTVDVAAGESLRIPRRAPRDVARRQEGRTPPATCRCARDACTPANSRADAGRPPAPPGSGGCGVRGSSPAWHPRPSR